MSDDSADERKEEERAAIRQLEQQSHPLALVDLSAELIPHLHRWLHRDRSQHCGVRRRVRMEGGRRKRGDTHGRAGKEAAAGQERARRPFARGKRAPSAPGSLGGKISAVSRKPWPSTPLHGKLIKEEF